MNIVAIEQENSQLYSWHKRSVVNPAMTNRKDSRGMINFFIHGSVLFVESSETGTVSSVSGVSSGTVVDDVATSHAHV